MTYTFIVNCASSTFNRTSFIRVFLSSSVSFVLSTNFPIQYVVSEWGDSSLPLPSHRSE
jgi:hypothetical protein